MVWSVAVWRIRRQYKGFHRVLYFAVPQIFSIFSRNMLNVEQYLLGQTHFDHYSALLARIELRFCTVVALNEMKNFCHHRFVSFPTKKLIFLFGEFFGFILSARARARARARSARVNVGPPARPHRKGSAFPCRARADFACIFLL